MSKSAVEAPRSNLFMMLPEDLHVVIEKSHPLYDPRVELPVSEELVASILEEGVLESVIGRRNGAGVEVVDGRQRVRAAQEANKILRDAGKEPIRIPVRVMRLDEEDNHLTKVVNAANIHIEDPPLVRARKVNDALQKGMSREEIATSMGVTTQAVENWLSFLDCSVRVQQAVEKGQISETLARQFAGMERADQDRHLAEMMEKGVTKGSLAIQSVRRVKRGKPILDRQRRGAGKMRSRNLVEGTLEHLEAYHTQTPDTVLAAVLLKWLLGDNSVREAIPIPVLECIAAAMGDLK